MKESFSHLYCFLQACVRFRCRSSKRRWTKEEENKTCITSYIHLLLYVLYYLRLRVILVIFQLIFHKKKCDLTYFKWSESHNHSVGHLYFSSLVSLFCFSWLENVESNVRFSFVYSWKIDEKHIDSLMKQRSHHSTLNFHEGKRSLTK